MTTLPAAGPRLPEATGRYCAPGPRPSGHIPFTPAAKMILELTLREAVALHDSHIGVEHIALALTTIKQGSCPRSCPRRTPRRRRCAPRSSTGTGGRADRYLPRRVPEQAGEEPGSRRGGRVRVVPPPHQPDRDGRGVAHRPVDDSRPGYCVTVDSGVTPT